MAEVETIKNGDVKETVKKLDEIIRGDGKVPGLSGRLAVVEQKVDSVYKLAWITLGSVVAYLASQILGLI